MKQIPEDKTILLDDFIENYLMKAVSRLDEPPSDSEIYKWVDILANFVSRKREDGKKEIPLLYAIEETKKWCKSIAEGDISHLLLPSGMRFDRIVDIEEFVKSKEYLNMRDVIRPRIMEELWRLFHSPESESYIEVALAGGIGYGKTTFAHVATAYQLYKLSCYFNPQLEYGLAPTTTIVFSMQSVRLEQAKKVLFNQFTEYIRQSPYFQRHFPFDKTITTELRFPNHILVLPLSSSDTAALGLNIYLAILDELNFLARVEDSVRSKNSVEMEYDQAEKLYTTALRRMRSRFHFAGKVPGKLYLISSANYPDDFMDRKVKEAERQLAETGSSSIFVVKMAQWEAFPSDRFCGDKFFVEVGDATRKSRILEKKEDAIDPQSVVEVPIEYREDFVRDLEAAIRDLAGIPVGGTDSFIKQREKIEEAARFHVERFEGKQLFTIPSIDILRFASNLRDLVNFSYFEYLIDTNIPFAAHLDLALKGDSAGVTIAHVDSFAYVGKSLRWDEETGKYIEAPEGTYPVIIADGVLEIIPPLAEEIDINLIGDLLALLAFHINLKWVTADRFQSASLLQRLRKVRNKIGKKIKTYVVSVDTTLNPYMLFKQALLDGRIFFPDIEKLKRELRELQLDSRRQRVDHPITGGKDLADSLCGSFYTLSTQYARGRSFSRRLLSSASESATVSDTRTLRIRRLH